MLEPIISYHRLVQENGKDIFKPMNRLDFGDIEGSGDSDELEFYIWNNFNGARDVPNLQLPELIAVQSLPPPVGSADNTEVVENNWLSVREYDKTAWTKLGKAPNGKDLELSLSRTLTGLWNDGKYDDPDTKTNYIKMAAKLTVPMNADVTLPYIFDLKLTGKYV